MTPTQAISHALRPWLSIDVPFPEEVLEVYIHESFDHLPFRLRHIAATAYYLSCVAAYWHMVRCDAGHTTASQNEKDVMREAFLALATVKKRLAQDKP